MSEEIELLKLVCNRLENANIPYMLTGSLAANFYAVPRMTRDIDFVVEIPEMDVSKFFLVFHKDFYIDKIAIAEAVKYQQMFNAIHQESVFKVDFVIRKNSTYRNEEFRRRRQITLGEGQIWIVSPEDLIISKLFWAKDNLSDLQLRDVRNLLVSIKNLDAKYIQDWVQTLGLNAIYEKVKVHE